MMDGRYLPLIALGGGIMGGRLGRGLQGFAQATMQGQAMDREARQDEQRQKMLELQTGQMEAQVAAQREREQVLGQLTAGMDPQQANFVRALGPEALQAEYNRLYGPKEAKSGLGQLHADFAAGLIDEPTYRAALRKETYVAPPAAVDSFTTLTPQEAAAAGFAPGTVVQRNNRTGKLDVGQQPQSGPAPITKPIRQPDGSIQDSISYDNGHTWHPLGAADPNQPKPIPTADGRIVEQTPDGSYRDVTPPVSGIDSLPEPPKRPVGPDIENAVGAVPYAAEALSKTAGQFIAGANNPDVTEARTRLQLLTRQAQSAFALSGRPTNWEQQRISTMLPSDGVFESPARARTALGVLKEEASRAYNEYGQLLQSPSIDGNARAELMNKRLELKRLVDSIDVGQATPAAEPIIPDPVRPDWNPDETGVPVFKMVNGKLQRASP